MARAYSIWILRNKVSRQIVGAWTVKHEMVAFIERNEMPRKSFEMAYEVKRVRDGIFYSGTTIPWEDIS